MRQCGAEEGHLVVMDRRSEERRGGGGTEDRQGSESAKDPRDGDGDADGGGRRQDGRGVVVWML